MNRILCCITALVLLVPIGFAQTSKSENNSSVVPKEQQATREDVLALMQVMHTRRQTVAVFEMLKEQFAKSMHDSFLSEHPNASPALLKRLDTLMDPVWALLKVEDVENLSIPIYQKYLSHEDVISLISFYSSPAGQHFLERMPALTKEAGEAGGNLMRQHTAEIQAEAKIKMAEFDAYLTAHPEELGAPKDAGSN